MELLPINDSWQVNTKYWLKMCPNCHGDLYENQDRFGTYVACLQCARSLGTVERMGLTVPKTSYSEMNR